MRLSGIGEGSGQDRFSVTSLLVMILVSWSDYHGISKCKAVCCKTHLLSDFCAKNPRGVHDGNELQSPSYFTKNQHISICQESVHSLHPASPAKMIQNVQKPCKWWDNPTTLNAGLDCLLSTSISPFFVPEHVQGKETCRADQLISTFGRPKFWEKDPFRDVWQVKCGKKGWSWQ